MKYSRKKFNVIPDKVGNVELERWVNKQTGHYFLKIPHEKRGSKKIDVNNLSVIRDQSLLDVINCTRYIHRELHGSLICHCSFQVILALCAEYLHIQKTEVKRIKDDDCTYRTFKMYDNKHLYNVAHSVIALAIELEGIGI